MLSVSVDTPSHAYEVEIGEGLLERASEKVAKITSAQTIALVTDSNVAPLYAAPLEQSLREAGFTPVRIVLEAGESSKNSSNLIALLETLAQHHLTRSDALIALGGGVVGDLAGLAAGLYLRGITYVQMPTTLLAAVDSSVGGKTAIDLSAGKNLAGMFYQPSLVLCDTSTLATLPQRELSNGLAEVIKYAVIDNPDLLDLCNLATLHPTQINQIIHTCVQIKARLVSADETDRGLRQMLNLGHTMAHAIEAYSSYTTPHGEAVAIGLMIMARACAHHRLCDREVPSRISDALMKSDLPTSTDFPHHELLDLIGTDKKRSGDSITLVTIHDCMRTELTTMTLDNARTFLATGMKE